MLTLNFRKNRNGVPVLSKENIEVLSEQVISSYKPIINFEAESLDIEYFIESYMGLDMDYKDLSHDRSILGIMVFDNCQVPVYDIERDKAKYIAVDQGTIIIDNILLVDEQLRRGRFTLAHEAAHWFLHKQVYIKDKKQISLFDNLEVKERKLPVIKCRTSDIENIARKELSTDNDFIEWQADYMAAALLMPKNIFSIVTRDKFKTAHILKGFYEFGIDYEMDLCVKDIISELANIFEVSITATKIRLKNLGFIRELDNRSPNLFE